MKTESLKTDSLLNIDEIVNNYTKSYGKKDETDELQIWSEPLVDDHIKFSDKKQTPTKKTNTNTKVLSPLKDTKIALTSSLELTDEKARKSTNKLKLTQVFSDFSFDDLLAEDEQSNQQPVDNFAKTKRPATLEFNLPSMTELLDSQDTSKLSQVHKTNTLKTKPLHTQKLVKTKQLSDTEKTKNIFKTSLINDEDNICNENKATTKSLKTKRQTKIIDIPSMDKLDLDKTIPTKTVRFDASEQTKTKEVDQVHFSKTTRINHKDYEDPFNFSDFDEIYKSMENNQPTTPIVEFTHKTVAFSNPTKTTSFGSTKSFSKIFFNDDNNDLTQELDNRSSISFEPSSKCEKKRFFTTFFKRKKNN